MKKVSCKDVVLEWYLENHNDLLELVLCSSKSWSRVLLDELIVTHLVKQLGKILIRINPVYNFTQLFFPCPNSKLQYNSMSAVRHCSFNIFTANLHIWRPSPPFPI
jgi:hypothetical protein